MTKKSKIKQPLFDIVNPVLPVAPWQGGKLRLAKRLISHIESIPHDIYVEPFVGMGGVFFRRSKKPKSEVINDLSRDVANLFRILQHHYVAFIDYCRWKLSSRDEFEWLINQQPNSLTDLQRAARFIYLQRLAFGGKVKGQNFGVSKDRPGRFDVTKLEPMLADVHERLASVVIECLSFDQLIPRYDSKETLFYLDPPYFNCENDYGEGMFGRGDFEILAKLLNNIKGAFILSLNDHPEVHRIFNKFHIQSVLVNYGIGVTSKDKKFGEVIISNRLLKTS